MKKLLTTLFAVFVVVSAFATVDVQTITPNVYYQGACERVGTMKFVVANDQDYQGATSQNFILVKIQLTDGATLCKNIFEDSDGNPVWGILEVDGTHWVSGDVMAFGAAGDDVIYVKICAAPSGTPNANDQAWFILGNTQAVGNSGVVFDPHAICVNFQGSTFSLNSFFQVSITDYTVAADCTDNTLDPRNMTTNYLGTSYQPANPAIAYGQPESTHNFIIGATCSTKNGNADADLSEIAASDDVLLCQCYTSDTPQQGQTEYECHDLYRIGTLILDDGDCQAYLKEDSIGMLPAGSIIEFSVVDASGNPIDVYFAGGPTLTTDTTSGLTVSGPVGVNLVDAASADEYSDMNYDGMDGLDGCPDYYDTCVDYYNLYEKLQYTVTAASTASPGIIYLGNFNLGRLTSAGPIEAYLKVSWYPVPCGTGNYKVILKSLKFVDCPDESEYQPHYFQNAIYFPYFPNTGYWWSGLAITNVNYFYGDVLPTLNSFWTWVDTWGYLTQTINLLGYNQDVNVTLYLIEEDGDVYIYDAGTLPKSGIITVLLSDPSFSPVLMSGYTDDAFGDEKFWVVAVGTATVGDSPITIDGFGMLGDGTQAQGFLPRIPTVLDAMEAAWYGYLNNKKGNK